MTRRKALDDWLRDTAWASDYQVSPDAVRCFPEPEHQATADGAAVTQTLDARGYPVSSDTPPRIQAHWSSVFVGPPVGPVGNIDISQWTDLGPTDGTAFHSWTYDSDTGYYLDGEHLGHHGAERLILDEPSRLTYDIEPVSGVMEGVVHYFAGIAEALEPRREEFAHTLVTESGWIYQSGTIDTGAPQTWADDWSERPDIWAGTFSRPRTSTADAEILHAYAQVGTRNPESGPLTPSAAVEAADRAVTRVCGPRHPDLIHEDPVPHPWRR